MSKVFTAKDIKLMGEPHPQFGQTYWGSVHEQALPVRFNLKEQIDFFPGRLFAAEEWVNKTASSGNDYTQLKKVRTVEKGEKSEESMELVADSPSPSSPSNSRSTSSKSIAPISSGDSYEPGTNARWALKLSIDTFKSVLGRVPEDDTDHLMLHDFAEWLLDEFQRLKSYSGTQTSGDFPRPDSGASQSEQSATDNQDAPGYEKFQASRPSGQGEQLSAAEANDFLKSLDEDELVD